MCEIIKFNKKLNFSEYSSQKAKLIFFKKYNVSGIFYFFKCADVVIVR